MQNKGEDGAAEDPDGTAGGEQPSASAGEQEQSSQASGAAASRPDDAPDGCSVTSTQSPRNSTFLDSPLSGTSLSRPLFCLRSSAERVRFCAYRSSGIRIACGHAPVHCDYSLTLKLIPSCLTAPFCLFA